MENIFLERPSNTTLHNGNLAHRMAWWACTLVQLTRHGVWLCVECFSLLHFGYIISFSTVLCSFSFNSSILFDKLENQDPTASHICSSKFALNPTDVNKQFIPPLKQVGQGSLRWFPQHVGFPTDQRHAKVPSVQIKIIEIDKCKDKRKLHCKCHSSNTVESQPNGT